MTLLLRGHAPAIAVVAVLLLAALVAAAVLGLRWFRAHRERLAALAIARWHAIAASPSVSGFRERHPRLWAAVAARLARGAYLGIHLTVGFALSVLALALFAGVTEDVVNREPLTAVDLQLATWLRAHALPAVDWIALRLSDAGSPVAMSILGVVVAFELARRRWWVSFSGWAAAFVGGGLLDLALKRAIHRPRPVGAQAFLHGATFSFPSGHAMGSLIGYGMLAYFLVAFWSRARRHRTWITVGTALLVLLIGLSRLVLGVHYLSDVVGGFAAGIVWLAACATGVDLALRHRGVPALVTGDVCWRKAAADERR